MQTYITLIILTITFQNNNKDVKSNMDKDNRPQIFFPIYANISKDVFMIRIVTVYIVRIKRQ